MEVDLESTCLKEHGITIRSQDIREANAESCIAISEEEKLEGLNR